MEGRGGDFAARDREAAVNVGEAARDAGVERIVYLGGLGAEASSEHLRSRAEVAELLRARVPQLVHARAAMIIGPGSASFEILKHLTQRLPLMIAPRWLVDPHPADRDRGRRPGAGRPRRARRRAGRDRAGRPRRPVLP